MHTSRFKIKFESLARRIGLGLLCLWAMLGAGHTTISFIRKGFPPNRPPLAGIDQPPHAVAGVLILNQLVEHLDRNRLLILLPETTDTGTVVFYRAQLNFNHYPLRVYARRLRESVATEVAGEHAVILPAGVKLPPGWIQVASRDSLALHVRALP